MEVAVALPEVAVMVTCPTPACPIVAWQLTMLASHTPPQTAPPVETVAIAVLLLVKVMSAATMDPAEFWAVADNDATPPSLSEMVAGVRVMVTTVVFALLLPPPHPMRRARRAAVESAARTETTGNRRMYPPRRTENRRIYETRIIPYGKPSVSKLLTLSASSRAV